MKYSAVEDDPNYDPAFEREEDEDEEMPPVWSPGITRAFVAEVLGGVDERMANVEKRMNALKETK